MPSSEPPEVGARLCGKILVAEDDAELRALIGATLRGAGYEVVEACDGDALIDKLSDVLLPEQNSAAFDLILSDIRMPNFSALDVLVGARRFIGKIPVVLMTAFGDASTHERARRRGAYVVLNKPVRLSELRDTVDQVLSRAREAALESQPDGR
jgi:CheY-like chemotaxis protein